MSQNSHDTLAHRLAQMLIKLNQGQKLEPQALADEFGVNLRTIQRDLNERFAYLPLIRTESGYQLDPLFLGKLSTKDIGRFAGLAGIRGLFPSLSDDFLRDIFDAQVQPAFVVKGHHYEDLSSRSADFRLLEQAILDRRHVAFDYAKPGGNKHYPTIAPFKLVNDKGIWYLVAKDGSKLKSFSFRKLALIRVLDSSFEPDADVERTLATNDGIWLGGPRTEVLLKIGAEVADYFRRRKLIANQVIVKDLEDGGLILSTRIGHANQILPIVRYWMPHIRIISPEALQSDLELDIAEYLAGTVIGQRTLNPPA